MRWEQAKGGAPVQAATWTRSGMTLSQICQHPLPAYTAPPHLQVDPPTSPPLIHGEWFLKISLSLLLWHGCEGPRHWARLIDADRPPSPPLYNFRWGKATAPKRRKGSRRESRSRGKLGLTAAVQRPGLMEQTGTKLDGTPRVVFKMVSCRKKRHGKRHHTVFTCCLNAKGNKRPLEAEPISSMI